jgi:predicted  nucleic acid-binding Zn-ribbon protein
MEFQIPTTKAIESARRELDNLNSKLAATEGRLADLEKALTTARPDSSEFDRLSGQLFVERERARAFRPLVAEAKEAVLAAQRAAYAGQLEVVRAQLDARSAALTEKTRAFRDELARDIEELRTLGDRTSELSGLCGFGRASGGGWSPWLAPGQPLQLAPQILALSPDPEPK